jgi:hypothetical protein
MDAIQKEHFLREKLEIILFDLGKEIKILKIDKDNIILDVPYSEYINKIIKEVMSIYNESNK